MLLGQNYEKNWLTLVCERICIREKEEIFESLKNYLSILSSSLDVSMEKLNAEIKGWYTSNEFLLVRFIYSWFLTLNSFPTNLK